jgi:hypothetical protein
MDIKASLDGLSVDAINAAKDSERLSKLKQQAEGNVIRQQNTAAMRGDSGKGRGGPPPQMDKAPPVPPAGKPAADKKAQEAASKAHAQKIVKIQKYLTNPLLSRYLDGIQPPRTWGVAEVDQTLEIINDRLNSGLGSVAVKSTWLKVLQAVDPHLSKLPDKAAIPPGSHNFAAMKMRELDLEFEQIAIEYGHWFSAGPLMRLVGKTMGMLLEYKVGVENGDIPLLVSDPNAIPEEVQQKAEEQIAEQEPGIELPPPMKIYPDPRPAQSNSSIVLDDREIPMHELRAAHVAMKEEGPPAHLFQDPITEPVFSSDDGAASSSGKKAPSSRGRGRPGKSNAL